jgi:CheY-like chemotaxis protein/GNAT superfamily N-acetyltransferase
MARIMIVDDTLLIRRLLREIAAGGGHDVVAEAKDGDEAIAHARKQRPDLVTLDLVMPRRDGFQTLPELRLIDPTVLVIVCSAWLTEPRVTTALRLGANGFLAKPFDRSTLLGVLDAVLTEAGADRHRSQTARSPTLTETETETGDERREFDRVAAALPVVVRCTDGEPIETSTIDISGGGMLVQACPAVPNDHVRFQLTLEPGDTPIEGTARVVRVADDGDCALAVEELRAADHERLIAYIRRNQSVAARVAIIPVDPEHPDAQACLAEYVAELNRRSERGFDPSVGATALPHEVRPPAGAFFVAYLHGKPIGCGAVRHHSGAPAEIKRMWIAPAARGLGLGRRLLDTLEGCARSGGAELAHIETSAVLGEALALYRSTGWVDVPPFNEEPFADHWLEKSLSDPGDADPGDADPGDADPI